MRTQKENEPENIVQQKKEVQGALGDTFLRALPEYAPVLLSRHLGAHTDASLHIFMSKKTKEESERNCLKTFVKENTKITSMF